MVKKILLGGAVICALLLNSVMIAKPAVGKIQSYTSGDALYHDGAVYVTTANLGVAELFKVEKNTISKIAEIKVISPSPTDNGFVDALLNEEQSGLFWFLSDGKYIYKYDINSPADPILSKKTSDSSGAQFTGLGRVWNKVYSVSNQGIKVYDDDLSVYYTSTLTNYIAHNIKLSNNNDIIFSLDDNQLKIYGAASQNLMASAGIVARNNHERNTYYDQSDSMVYLADDQMVKQFDLSGKLINSFKHTSSAGYDVAYAAGDDYFYFSDGIGVVKLNKKDLKPLKWIYTDDMGEASGWATGLKAVRDNFGEKVIVFNNESIVVLDENLKKIASIKMPTDVIPYYLEEGLAMSANRHSAASGSSVTVSGRGFDVGENLSIYLADKKIDSLQADNYGRFSRVIQIPFIKSIAGDIRVAGDSSGKTFSTSFYVAGIDAKESGNRPQISLDKTFILAGEEVTVSGSGYNPTEYILIYADLDKVGVVKADSYGQFSQTVKMSRNKSGRVEIVAVGYDSYKHYTVNLQVEPNINSNIQPVSVNLARSHSNDGLLLTLDKTIIAPGGEVTVSGSGYNPGEYVLIYADFDKIGVVKTDSGGQFSQTVKIRENKIGYVEIRVAGYDSLKHNGIYLLVQNAN